jgi:hypothetical protein
MTVGFRNSAGVDFDSLFDLYVQGTPPANTGFRSSAGVDLAGRYAPISFGTKGPNVGFRTSAGLDVSNLWAAFGTAQYLPSSVFARSLSNVGGAQAASLSVAIKTNGTIVITTNGTTIGGGGTYNYVPTAVGASSPFDFRVSGTVGGVKGSAAVGSVTGKGGVSFTSGLPPSGSTAAIDTGWIASADDVANFLLFQTSVAHNAGGSTLDMFGSGKMRIQVRRKSDSVVVYDATTTVAVASDSQI